LPRILAACAFNAVSDVYVENPRRPDAINEVDRRPALKVDFWMLRSPPSEMAMFERRLGVNLLPTFSPILTIQQRRQSA
jgi:hypothetical protein